MSFYRELGRQAILSQVLLAAIVFVGQPLRAQSSADQSQLSQSALSIAPQDAAFVATSLNLRESWAEFLNGNFVRELMQIPYVQRLEAAIKEKMQTDDPNVAKAMAMLRSPNGKILMNIGSDMFSQEFFVIGGSEWCTFAEGFAELQAEINAAAGGGEEAMKEFVLGLGKDVLDEIEIPTTVIGFRLTSDANVRTFLDVLESTIRFGLGSIEPVKPFLQELKRNDLTNGQILTWTVNAEMIPWDQLPIADLTDEQKGMVDHLTELLEDRQITVSLGTIDNRLMIAISEEADVLQKLGQGENLLGHPRLKQLVAAAPPKMRSVSFTSAAWRAASYQLNFGNYFGNLAAQIGSAGKATTDDEKVTELIEQAVEDAQEVDEQLAQIIEEFDDALMYSYATKQGIEGQAWDWTKNPFLANAKPMSILKNAGTKPLVVMAVKTQWPKQLGEIVEDVIDMIPDYADRIIEAELLREEDVEHLELVTDKILPLVKEGIAILREKICPSLDKHENLLAVAAQLTTTTLGEDSPPIPEPLPILEIAGASRLSNRDLFLSGCEDMLELMNKVVVLVRELKPDAVPESYTIPVPEEESIAGGTRYYYNLPKEGLPIEGIQAQILVTNNAITYGYSTRQVTDMAEEKPLVTRPAWLTSDSEVAAVSYVDFAGLLAAAKPWITFALVSANGDLDEPLQPEDDFPVPTGNDILRIWDCFHAFGKIAGTSIVDASHATVSRWVWVSE